MLENQTARTVYFYYSHVVLYKYWRRLSPRDLRSNRFAL